VARSSLWPQGLLGSLWGRQMSVRLGLKAAIVMDNVSPVILGRLQTLVLCPPYHPHGSLRLPPPGSGKVPAVWEGGSVCLHRYGRVARKEGSLRSLARQGGACGHLFCGLSQCLNVYAFAPLGPKLTCAQPMVASCLPLFGFKLVL
jgi:hypothetical protein